MKKTFILFSILFTNFIFADQWVNINSTKEKSPDLNIISSDFENTYLEFKLDGFNKKSIFINDIEHIKVSFPGSASNLDLGYPDLPSLSKSIIIPNDGLMNIETIKQEYVEFDNMYIVPSKGNISREVDPSTINYFFNDVYINDLNYPDNNAELRDPYILRDFRGQTVTFNPFSYNPITKKLRVYTYLKIRVYNEGVDQRNVLNDKVFNKIDKEFKNIYKNHFINFDSSTRFDYLSDKGNMLVISYGGFMETMNPFLDWKNIKGISTEMIDVASIGSSASAIDSYVTEYYNNNGLTFLLLVGDIAQIPSTIVSGSASDVSYGCILGNDFYPEVIVGRFSGSTPSQIQTQVDRSINYDRFPQAGADWYDNALGVASNQGPGFSGYSDDVFNDFLWDTVLSGFTYDNYQGIYDGSGGTTNQGIDAINSGVSLINYTGHGSISSWGNGAPISTSNINSLVNNNLLPFVITVGCNVGEFNSTDECYTESWLRATNNGEPTGAIGHFGSTISQSWEPPMHGQYAMNLILTESFNNEISRTTGGITTNGCMYMNDAQGSSGINETQYWTYFGDPSINLRTAPPSNLNLVHEDVILVGQTEFVVDVGEDGVLIALSKQGELLSSAYSIGGVGVLQLNEDLSGNPGQVDIVATGFNSFTYESSIMVVAPEGAYLVIDDLVVNSNLNFDGNVDYGDNIEFYMNVGNIGSDNVSYLDVTLTSDNNYIDLESFSDTFDIIINPGSSGQIGPFSFFVYNDVPNDHPIQIECNMSDGQFDWESTISFTGKSPEIIIENIEGNLTPGQDTMIHVSLANIGGANINYPVVTAEGDNQYVSVNVSGIANAYQWQHMSETLGSSHQEMLEVQVSVNPSTPIGYIADFSILVTNLSGTMSQTLSFMLPVGQLVESFENNFSELVDWVSGGDASWVIVEDEQFNGLYSAKSGDIDNSQSSTLSVTLDVVMDSQIDFYYKVESEYSPSGLYFYDGLEFYIDNQLQAQFAPLSDGQSPWSLASFPVQAGTRIFTWSYVKDGAGGTTDMARDSSWLDDIVFPPATINSGNILGDVNGDGFISILDIVSMINMVLDNEPSIDTADINTDGLVDVLDIILAVNIILDF